MIKLLSGLENYVNNKRLYILKQWKVKWLI